MIGIISPHMESFKELKNPLNVGLTVPFQPFTLEKI
jgi:hypothetical protein